MTTVDLSRAQFAATTVYHFLFVPITIGLAFLVAILQTVFLAGDVWPVILPNLFGLAVSAVVAIAATLAVTRRRLD